MKVRKQAHVLYKAQYHVVWIPRYRYKVLNKGVAKYLEIKFKEVRKYYPEIEYVEMNIQVDHVHLILSFPGSLSVSKVVQLLKSNTGRALKNKFDFLKERYPHGGVWTTGYFFSTVGLDETMIRNYVRYQEKEDLGQAELELKEATDVSPW